MLKRFVYHGLTVSNLNRSLAFYQDLLKMRLERTYEVAGEEIEEATGFPAAHLKVGLLSYDGHLLKLTQYLFPEGKKKFQNRINDLGSSHVTVLVDRLEETYEELSSKGVKFMSPPVRPFPVEAPEKMFTYLLDPDGCVVQMSPLSIGVHHHAHAIADEDKAVAFYRDVLGMKTGRIRDITGPGIEQGTGLPDVLDREIDMVLNDSEAIEFQHFIRPPGKNKNEIRLCDVGCSSVAFEVDDVGLAYKEVKARGGQFISSPVNLCEEGRDVRMAYLLDPEQYVLELRQVGNLIKEKGR